MRTDALTSGNVISCGCVANALGYSNPRDAISRHCKGVVKHDSFKEGGQEIALIPEGDIYRLVIKSQPPAMAVLFCHLPKRQMHLSFCV